VGLGDVDLVAAFEDPVERLRPWRPAMADMLQETGYVRIDEPTAEALHAAGVPTLEVGYRAPKELVARPPTKTTARREQPSAALPRNVRRLSASRRPASTNNHTSKASPARASTGRPPGSYAGRPRRACAGRRRPLEDAPRRSRRGLRPLAPCLPGGITIAWS